MIRRLALFALPLVALVGPPVAADEGADIDAAVTAIYAPYGAEGPDWDVQRALGNYSKDTAALIDRWGKAQPEDEVTELGDFDWLCECQDWDSSAFRLTIDPHHGLVGERVEVNVRIELGFDETRDERFLLVRENGAWKVDDLFSQSFPKGLKAALEEAIANPHPV